MDYSYIKNRYNVPSEYGREILFEGKRKGIIVGVEVAYILVNFYDEKPTSRQPLHPTSEVEYLGMGTPRKLTASQKRYQRFLEADSGLTFKEWLRVEKYPYSKYINTTI
jgi:hypothetical protein